MPARSYRVPLRPRDLTPRAESARISVSGGSDRESRMQRLREKLRLVALLAYGSAMLAGLNGRDLCIGASGHVALEFRERRCCTVCAEQPSGSGQAARLTARSGGCGDCVDIPLSFIASDHQAAHCAGAAKSAIARCESPLGAMLPSVVAQVSCPRPSVRDFLSPPPRSAPGLSLRSVVLRI